MITPLVSDEQILWCATSDSWQSASPTMDVRIYGDTAVMIIQFRFREQASDGITTDKLGRPTEVFVRRHGQWYLAQLVGSPLNQ